MSSPSGVRVRARRGDRARVFLAIVLILFTTLVGMLGAAPPVKSGEVDVAGPAVDQSAGARFGRLFRFGKGT
jgi:hypothetical protein